MTKSTHFLLDKITDPVRKLPGLYLKEIVRLRRVPVSIVSDRDARFTSMFWKELQAKLGIVSHPQTDGQNEWTMQPLKIY